jgi:hypothetical protein
VESEKEEGVVSLPGGTTGIRHIIGQSLISKEERHGNDGNNGR